MSRRPASWLALAAAVAALSACGNDGDGTIPPEKADELRAALDEVDGSSEQGLCLNAQEAAAQFLAAVNSLGADVDREVKGALQEGATRLVELSSDPDQCGTTGATGEQGQTDAGTPAEDAAPAAPTDEPQADEPSADEGGEGNGPRGGEPPGQGDDGGGDNGGGDNGSGGVGSDKAGG